MIEILVNAVGYRTVIVQGRENVLDRDDNIVQSSDVQVGLLLTGKGGIGKIFSGRRGAHGHRNIVAAFLRHAFPGFRYGLEQFIGKRCIDHPGANFSTGIGQRDDIVNIEIGKFRIDPFGKAFVHEETPVRFRGGGESAGHTDTQRREVADHLSE